MLEHQAINEINMLLSGRKASHDWLIELVLRDFSIEKSHFSGLTRPPGFDRLGYSASTNW